MASEGRQHVTMLLEAWAAGNQAAAEELLPMVYGELRRLARRHMARESPGHVLQTTALINQAYLRLADTASIAWRDRALCRHGGGGKRAILLSHTLPALVLGRVNR
jgi:hypothetical protein